MSQRVFEQSPELGLYLAPEARCRAGVELQTHGDQGRVQWVDCAKGITIILVVYNHVCSGLWTAGLPFWPGPYSELATIFSHVRVPLFFLLSGLFIERSARKPADVFIARKLKTLIYPYVVWYLIQSTVLYMFESVANSRPTPGQLVTEMLWRPRGQFWFLLVLFIGDILYLALNRLGVRGAGLLAVGAAMCLSTTAIDIHTLPITIRPFRAFIYLAIGVVAAPALLRWSQSFPVKMWLAILAFATVALFGVAALFPRAAWVEVPWEKTSWAYPVLASPLGMVVVVASSVLLVKLGWGRPLIFVGAMSLEILVGHILGTAGARVALVRVFGVKMMSVHLIAGTFAGLAVPIIVGWVARRYRFSYLFRL